MERMSSYHKFSLRLGGDQGLKVLASAPLRVEFFRVNESLVLLQPHDMNHQLGSAAQRLLFLFLHGVNHQS